MPILDKSLRFLTCRKAFVQGAFKTDHLVLGTGVAEPLGVDARLPADGNGVVFVLGHTDLLFPSAKQPDCHQPIDAKDANADQKGI
jgi:hypothetical protein